jgi:hypothetical protein
VRRQDGDLSRGRLRHNYIRILGHDDLLSGDDFNMQGHVFPPVPAARANQKISGA